MSAMDDGYPHDYGYQCCCEECDGPEGLDCTPDLYGRECVRCGRLAVPDLDGARILFDIIERIAAQAEGQTSWAE